MDLIKKEIEVPKETNELAVAVADLVIVTKKALDDGFQAGQDLPVIVTAALSSLLPAIDGAVKIPGEMKENAYKFALAWASCGEKVFEAFASEGGDIEVSIDEPVKEENV